MKKKSNRFPHTFKPILTSTAACVPSSEEVNQLMQMFNQQDHTNVELLAIQLTDKYPAHGFGWKALGAVLLQQNRLPESLEALETAAPMLPNDYDLSINKAIVCKRLGRFDEAMDAYRRALELQPNHAEAANSLGILLKAQGQLDEAAYWYQRAVQTSPDYTDALFNLGNLYQDAGRLADAAGVYRQALEKRPDCAKYHNNLAVVLKKLGCLAEAEYHGKKALMLHPEYVEATNNLGALFIDQNRFADAVVCLEKALTINGVYADIWNNLGAAYKELGWLWKARTAYLKAREINSDDPFTNQGLAIVYSFLSEYLQVQQLSDIAITHAPDTEIIWEQRLYAFSYHPDLSAEEIFAEFVRWGGPFPYPFS